ncbi:MAG: hypothetical protein WKF57_09940 [Nakamurella sp.]
MSVIASTTQSLQAQPQQMRQWEPRTSFRAHLPYPTPAVRSHPAI